ncbi:MAG: NAD(P)H-dependent oxidoreductase [Patescibacteria group bacterium]|nr:NAD(P)H-dependent oxidoreductase [Patescibacteria group bacterium]
MEKPYIPIVLGTAREGRQSEKVAQAVLHILKSREDIEIELIDVKEYIHGRTIPPSENNKLTKPWQEIVKRASAFLIVTPEYNHGYPGELKMLLDQDYDNYTGKLVVVCGVSKGIFGGTRVVENLLPVLRQLGLIVSQFSINVSRVIDFPEDPKLADEKFQANVLKAADVLIQMAKK